jgi:hypothetical protein
MMLTCKKAAELWLDFVEDNLPPEVHRAMAAHLAGCKPCELFLESYKKTSVLCRKALLKQAPAELGNRLLSFLRSEVNKKP